jgi:hypothetical protein
MHYLDKAEDSGTWFGHCERNTTCACLHTVLEGIESDARDRHAAQRRRGVLDRIVSAGRSAVDLDRLRTLIRSRITLAPRRVTVDRSDDGQGSCAVFIDIPRQAADTVFVVAAPVGKHGQPTRHGGGTGARCRRHPLAAQDGDPAPALGRIRRNGQPRGSRP